eukprot:9164615-Pyramimonas_sp.AAC.1
MALRGERIATRIRWTIHVPAEIMVADAMTKPGVFKQMMKLPTTGFLDIESVQKVATARRIVHRPDEYQESDQESIHKFNYEYDDNANMLVPTCSSTGFVLILVFPETVFRGFTYPQQPTQKVERNLEYQRTLDAST